MNKKFNDILVNFRLYRFQSIYIKMFVTFLCTSVLMIAIVGFISRGISVNSISNKVMEKNTDMLNYIQSQVDDEIQKLNLTAINIVNHNFLIRDFNEQDIDTKFEITNSFLNQFHIEEYVKSFDLYYSKSKLVVSSTTGYTPVDNDEMWEKVKQIINSINFSPVYLSEFGIKNNSDDSIFMVTPFPRGMNKHGVLCIEFSKKLFFDNVMQDRSNIILLLDENNKLISGNEEYYDKFISELNKKERDITDNLKIENREFMALCKKSSVNNWKYINIQRIRDLNRETNNISLLTIFLMIVCIMIGFVIWNKMSNDYYNPIISIIKKARDALNITNKSVKNELEMVDEIFEQMIINSNEANALYKQENNEMQKGILMSLCIGELKNVSHIEQQLRLINLPTDNSQYTIVSIVTEEVRQAKFCDICEETAENIRQYIKHYAETCVGKTYKCISTYMNNTLIMLIISKEVAPDTKMLNEMQKNIYDKYQIITTIGVGETYSSVVEIKKSYHQANNALNYKFFAGKGSIIYIRNYNLSNIVHFDPYADCEAEIMEMMKACERSKVLGFFDRMCNQIPCSIMMKEQISETLWQIVNYTVVCVVLKGFNYEDIYARSYSSCYMTYKEKEFIGEKINYIRNLLEVFFDYFENNSDEIKLIGEKRNDDIVGVIKDYIKIHIDGDLSINKIADVVFMTPTYVSTIFKKSTGENFGDYVRTERIKKAKELLCETRMDVNEISARVGYENSRSFMRIFKKYEGITPSEYRKKYLIDKI